MALFVRECEEAGYKARTLYNASADITVAFAIDFTTAGERLTKSAAKGHAYVAIDLLTKQTPELAAAAILLSIKDYKASVTSLNVAGNGIYTLADYFSDFAPEQIQQRLDKFVYRTLKIVHEHNPLTEIRSGGQTGADESGAKAGKMLGIETRVLLPLGFKYRNHKGEDLTATQTEAYTRLGNVKHLMEII